MGLKYKRAKLKRVRSTTLFHGRPQKRFFGCSQVEKGFGGSLVLHRYFDAQLDSTESDTSIDLDAIHKWRENLE